MNRFNITESKASETSEMPEASETLEAPKTLDVPEVPEAPEASEASEAPETSETLETSAPPPTQKAPEAAPEWVKDLRKAYRETKRENRELAEKLEALSKERSQPEAQAPLRKPTFEECDYDTAEYEKRLSVWFDREKAIQNEKLAAQQKAREENESWQSVLNDYQAKKAELQLPDYDEAEENVIDMFSQSQQSVILLGAQNPALVVYSLGNDLAQAAKLAKTQDPVKFAFAIAKLEAKMESDSKGPKTPTTRPETVPTTFGAPSTVDSTLERLRKEADRTGDYSKVFAYKRSKR